MRYLFTKRFAKQRNKLPDKTKATCDERLRIFLQDQFHPTLHNHKLHGTYADCRSININGDIRAVYWHVEPDLVEFVAIGTHSELYD
ncbi:type II toxin-antitoxin system mRNA interferase toxin, RelE/StbE family [Candidatus Kaiserbacteria bacterium]|nr:type II toxin-antitoxin system mRNA interferase toxin, RelE/StbE family [Candidatus Kaiserbacteria bacterium]